MIGVKCERSLTMGEPRQALTNHDRLSSAHPSNDARHTETCTPRDECYVLLLSGCVYCMGVDNAVDTNFSTRM